MPRVLKDDQLYVTVDLLILAVEEGRLQLLLSRRKDPPCEGQWALPGRFVGMEESAESAARRLLEEMLPIREVYLEQLYTFTRVDRDPRGRVVSVAYLAIVPSGRLAGLPADASLRPFRVETGAQDPVLEGENGGTLAGGGLAFDHGDILRIGIGRLQGKIDYTDIGFCFLRDMRCFALGELQSVFEAVLGRGLDASNFRRSIQTRYVRTGRIQQTDRTGKNGRGRPSGLYCLKEQRGSKT